MTHTPGPWKAVWDGIYTDAQDGRMCTVIANCARKRSVKETTANARLIAAAPSLSRCIR